MAMSDGGPGTPARRVLVIGAGPVGQTAALLLARWGIAVLLLDQRPCRDAVGSKAICQQRDVLDVWAAVGAGEQIAAEGVAWTTARTFYRDREIFSYPLADPGSARFPPFVNISQSRTEQVLDERIEDSPLIELRWDHHVQALDQDGDGVAVKCGTGAGQVEYRGAYALVCVGAHGEAIRDALGIEFDGRTFDDRFLICDIRTALPERAGERRFYFDPVWNPGRQVLIHPCPDSTFRIDWQVPPDYDVVADEAGGGLDRRIRAIIGTRSYEIVWRSVYHFSSRIASRMQTGRVLLAGDCAHLFAPFGARGLNSGVADAENAAWKIAFALRGWAPAALVDSYHAERQPAARENLDVTTATMDFLVPHSAAGWDRRRHLLERSAEDSVARDLIDSGRLAEPYWYPESPLITPDPARPAPGRPALGAAHQPGPGVIMPDVPVRLAGATRSREMLRDGFVIFGADEVDLECAGAAAAAVTPAPVRGYRFADVDPAGHLRTALAARTDELWIVRPDAHVAAVLAAPRPAEVDAAIRRALAMIDQSTAARTCVRRPRTGMT